MYRRSTIYTMFFLSLFGIILITTSCGETTKRKGRDAANVIIVLVDALRADHLGTYGYQRDTSPNIDNFAETSTVFTHVVSPSSWTKPSIPSLFTSLYPSRHGVFLGSSKDTEGHITSDVLHDSLLTMAEVFNQHGYSTAAFVHNAQLRGFLGFSQGFDLYQDRAGDAENINSQFFDWLAEREDRPFFAYLHYLDVHYPYQPPAPYDTLFGTFQSDIDFFTDEWKALRTGINHGEIELEEGDLQKMISLYDGEIRYLDEQLGTLFTTLRKKGLYHNTMLIFIADHGDEFLEHGKIGHGQSLYHELLRIPLMIKFPHGEWSGEKMNQISELVDLLPTITDYFGWQPPSGVDGHSLLPVLVDAGGEENSSRYAYAEVLQRKTYKRTVVGDNYKLIETFSGDFRARTPSHLLSKIHIGDRVEIDGMEGSDHTFIARSIALDDNQSDDDIEIEGPVSKLDGGDNPFKLMSFTIVPEPGVKVKGSEGNPLELNDIEDGMRIKVNGHIRDGNVIEIDRLRVKKREKTGYSLECVIDDLTDVGSDTTLISVKEYRILVTGETDRNSDESPGDSTDVRQFTEMREMYDLTQDPGEIHNLISLMPSRAQRLGSLLEQQFPNLPGTNGPKAADVQRLDEDTIEELRAIGYIK